MAAPTYETTASGMLDLSHAGQRVAIPTGQALAGTVLLSLLSGIFKSGTTVAVRGSNNGVDWFTAYTATGGTAQAVYSSGTIDASGYRYWCAEVMTVDAAQAIAYMAADFEAKR